MTDNRSLPPDAWRDPLLTMKLMGQIRECLESLPDTGATFHVKELLGDCADALLVLNTARPRGILGYQFTVYPSEGISERFPVDMLRYDSCAPMYEGESGKISMTFRRLLPAPALQPGPEPITLFSPIKPPSIDRWLSFGWGVKDIRTIR